MQNLHFISECLSMTVVFAGDLYEEHTHRLYTGTISFYRLSVFRRLPPVSTVSYVDERLKPNDAGGFMAAGALLWRRASKSDAERCSAEQVANHLPKLIEHGCQWVGRARAGGASIKVWTWQKPVHAPLQL